MSETFSEARRYEYPLTKESLVIDGGGFQGNFAKQIAEKYGCPVICYEPIESFHRAIVVRILRNEIGGNVVTVNSGLGGSTRREKMGIKGDSSGIAATGVPTEVVEIVDICAVMDFWLQEFNRPTVALLKLNVEGQEFEIMERLLDSGYVARIDHIQCQPHNIIPDAERRWEAIKNRMLITHRVSFDSEWCWTGWERSQ